MGTKSLLVAMTDLIHTLIVMATVSVSAMDVLLSHSSPPICSKERFFVTVPCHLQSETPMNQLGVALVKHTVCLIA